MINVSLPARTSSTTVGPSAVLVVGTVYSEGSLSAALALAPPPAAPDLIELRVDHFATDRASLDALEALAGQSRRGFIVTVRDRRQGGHGELEPERRRALYERFMPCASYADIELSSLDALAPVAEQARRTPGGLIVSHHDFQGLPALARLRELAGRAADAGAAIFKLAARAERPKHVSLLLEFLAIETRIPLAVMGMGPFGRFSRLAAAAAGSRLNYGYLGDVAQVPGQWPAAALRARIDELQPEAIPAPSGNPNDPEQRT